MKRIIAIALAMILTGTATAYAAMTTVHLPRKDAEITQQDEVTTAQPEKPAPTLAAETEKSDEQPTPTPTPQASSAAATPQAETPSQVVEAETTAEVQSAKASFTSGSKRPLPLPPPTEMIAPAIPEPGTGADPQPVPEPDPPQPPATIIGNIYSCEEAAQAGHNYMTAYGWVYAGDLSMAAGNCGYYPAVVLTTAYLQSSGGQTALNQAVIDTVDDTYTRLYARNGEDAQWASVRCEVSYREAADEYVINILYA